MLKDPRGERTKDPRGERTQDLTIRSLMLLSFLVNGLGAQMFMYGGLGGVGGWCLCNISHRQLNVIWRQDLCLMSHQKNLREGP